MLSKVAGRMYWLARYLERAENSARLLGVYDSLLLDMPPDAGIGWGQALETLGVSEDVRAEREQAGERAMLEYLLLDPDNPGSLLGSLDAARENARTTRDVVPNEAWRTINELFLFGRDKLPRLLDVGQRFEVLSNVIGRCQQITGLLHGTMSHGPAYQFVRIGRSLERADMTTRLIDVAAAVLLSGRSELRRYDNRLWMAILRSLSGYQMYRQYVRRRIIGADVIAFLLQDAEFPRSVRCCLADMDAAVEKLPGHNSCRRDVAAVAARVEGLDTSNLDAAGIHGLIDGLQLSFAGLDQVVFATWLSPDLAA